MSRSTQEQPGRSEPVNSDGSINDGLRSRLVAKQGVLTPSERRIAQWLERSFEQLAFFTVSEVSQETGVSEATIVRFARKLDYDSFTALQREAQAALQRQYSVGARIQELARGDEGPLSRAYRRDLENMQRTYENAYADEAMFDAAVEAIAQARNVVVVGYRASAGAAIYISFALNLVRPRVTQLRADLDNINDQLLDLGPDDVIIAVSLARPALQTLEAVQEAKHRYNATVVVFASSTVSAVARLADHLLLVSGEGTFNSYAATFSLAGALLDSVASTLHGTATSRLKRLDAVNANGIYAE